MPFALALAISLVAVPLARRAGLAAGLVDRGQDTGLAIHTRPVAILGGPAVVGGTLGAAALSDVTLIAGVVVAICLALAIGVADDVRPLPPSLRLALLAGAGGTLAATGIRVTPLGVLASAATVILVVACANATNLIDGQNGLAGGLAALAAVGLAGVAPAGSPARGLGLAMIGALVAFLLWNVPGRIFLGNGGAYAVGTLLALLAAEVSAEQGWAGLLAALACLSVFAFEMVFTVARRMASGASLAVGDRNHSYDLVSVRVSSRLRSTLVFWAAGMLGAAAGIWIGDLPVAAGAVVTTVGAALATGWGVLLWSGRQRMSRI